MADEKVIGNEVGAIIIGHLQIYAEKVAEVVDDYRNMQKNREMPQAGKTMFTEACMKDVSELTTILAGLVHKTMTDAGIKTPPPPLDDTPSEADVIDLETYRNNGGLLN